MRDFAHAPANRRQGAIKYQQPRPWLGKTLLSLATAVTLVWLAVWLWPNFSQKEKQGVIQPGQASVDSPQQTLIEPDAIPTRDETQPVAKAPESGFETDEKTRNLAHSHTPAEGRTNPELEETLPSLPSIKEPYAFYDLLSRPATRREVSPEVWDRRRVYKVKTDLLNTREQALKLRAQLYFLGYSRVEVQRKWFNQRMTYRVVVSEIESRSKMNKLLDFFTDMDLQADYSFRTE